MSYAEDQASIRGVFRDSKGQWLCGYSWGLHKETIFRIEARVILEGLHIAWKKGFRQLEIECDNPLLVESFLAGNAAFNNIAKLRLIYYYFARDWKTIIFHIPKTRNRDA